MDFITAWSRNLIATYVNTHRLNTPPHREAGGEVGEGGLKYEAESRIAYLCIGLRYPSLFRLRIRQRSAKIYSLFITPLYIQ